MKKVTFYTNNKTEAILKEFKENNPGNKTTAFINKAIQEHSETSRKLETLENLVSSLRTELLALKYIQEGPRSIISE